MSEIRFSSKKGGMKVASRRDRLSELPSDIIHAILSYVPTREVVRMSTLSKHFRYTWTTVPCLLLDLWEFRSDNHIKNFVTNVLKLHQGPIHKFDMSALLKNNCPVFDEWLRFLPTNEMRELILNVVTEYSHYSEWLEARPIVYSCDKLTYLELFTCKLGSPPSTFTGFLLLRSLFLVEVRVPSLKDVESIVAGSPLLEKLILSDCRSKMKNLELRIHAPRLKYFQYRNPPAECIQIYICAPLLADMNLSLQDFDFSFLRKKCIDYNYADFFASCTSLQTLRGNFFHKAMSYGVNSCHYSFAFPHLKVIDLTEVYFGDVKETVLAARLMAGAPNLEQLELECVYGYISDSKIEDPDASYMDVLRASNFKWEKLRTIKMKGFDGIRSAIEFLRLLLEKSPALERMNLSEIDFECQEHERCFRDELLKCKPASRNFKLRFW